VINGPLTKKMMWLRHNLWKKFCWMIIGGWRLITYLLFTAPIYDVLRETDTDMTTLHLVYEM